MRLGFVTLTFAWIGLASAVILPFTNTELVISSSPRVTDLLWSPEWDYESVWKTILEKKDQAVTYASVALDESKKQFEDVSDKIEQFKGGMNQAVGHAQEIKVLFEQYQADPQAIIDRLNVAGSDAVDNLQKEFEKPLPEDMDERAKYRAEMVASVLGHMEHPFVSTCIDLSIPEDKAREIFEKIRHGLEDSLLIAGSIVDRHPVLVETIVISAVFLLLPEMAILRPFVRLFGFGGSGPVKGTLAAWLQSRFWGGAVARGSWFAWMQRAGMVTVRSWWPSVIIASILKAIAALFGF